MDSLPKDFSLYNRSMPISVTNEKYNAGLHLLDICLQLCIAVGYKPTTTLPERIVLSMEILHKPQIIPN